MGDAAGEADEMPVSRVKIDKPFYMGECEITNAQYAAFDPQARQRRDQHDRQGPERARLPVEPARTSPWSASPGARPWTSASGSRRRTGKHYAADRGPMGMGLPRRDRHALLLRRSGHRFLAVRQPGRRLAVATLPGHGEGGPSSPSIAVDDKSRSRPHVGPYQPNAWGLSDMHGNAAEWTRSSYRPYPFRADDAREAGREVRKVVRGGSWYDRPTWPAPAAAAATGPGSGLQRRFPRGLRRSGAERRVACDAVDFS